MMGIIRAFDDSERLVAELLQLVDLPTIDSDRVRISYTACSLALEHWRCRAAETQWRER
jgi:hypothetical protein